VTQVRNRSQQSVVRKRSAEIVRTNEEDKSNAAGKKQYEYSSIAVRVRSSAQPQMRTILTLVTILEGATNH